MDEVIAETILLDVLPADDLIKGAPDAADGADPESGLPDAVLPAFLPGIDPAQDDVVTDVRPE